MTEGLANTLWGGIRFVVRRFCRVLWLLLPVALFLSLEWTARHWQRVQPPVKEDIWTAKTHAIRANVPVNYAFIGSSRVAAAVDEKVFEEELARSLGHPVQAINFGHGYTCMIQHYLNLRNLQREHPDQMRGCTVFIEAFGGLPEAGGWNARWFYNGFSHHVLPLLQQEDLPKLWASEMTPDERLQLNEDVRILTDMLTRHCALLKNRDRMSNEVMAVGQRVFDKVMLKALRRRSPAPAPVADLRAAGGIRNDVVGVELARKMALDWLKIVMTNQGPCRIGDESVVFDLIRLVKGMGGHVVFYEMPIHSVQATAYQTPIRLEDRKFFQQQMAAVGVPYLMPEFVTRDEDLPDYWHLSKTRSPEFTRALAKAWVEAAHATQTAQLSRASADKGAN